MVEELLKPVIRPLVSLLVQGDFAAVVAACRRSRLRPEDLAEVVRDYGRQFIEPPEVGWKLDFVAVEQAESPAWSVYVPLVTREERQSDLTLSLTIVRSGDRWEVEIDDLHVL